MPFDLDAKLADDIVGAVDAGFDERVSLSSTKRVTAAIALFIAEWCGLERV